MRKAGPAGLDRLGGERAAALKNSKRRHHRNTESTLLKDFLYGVQATLENKRVEGGFGEQNINITVE